MPDFLTKVTCCKHRLRTKFQLLEERDLSKFLSLHAVGLKFNRYELTLTFLKTYACLLGETCG
jgi:hypothetical protein